MEELQKSEEGALEEKRLLFAWSLLQNSPLPARPHRSFRVLRGFLYVPHRATDTPKPTPPEHFLSASILLPICGQMINILA